MRVLIACDKFKDALTAPQACAAVAGEVRRRHPGWDLDECPLADGGEGFTRILTGAAGGVRMEREVTGPEGTPVRAGFGLVVLDRVPAAARRRLHFAVGIARVAVVEMAEASGLALVTATARNPWNMTTFGTGQLVRSAIEAGADGIILGVGGSATHDLGAGALAALGLHFKNKAGSAIDPPYPREWSCLVALDGDQDTLRKVPLRIACDVSNPLLGPDGAAAVFGPQKGLPGPDLATLESATERMGRLLAAWAGRDFPVAAAAPGAGAAGGIAFGFMVAAGAELVPGADLIFDWLDLDRRIEAADLVITGEGRFDDSSLSGKGPGALAARALAVGRRTFVFAGQARLTKPLAGLRLHTITPAGMPLPQALATAEDNLRAAAAAARFE